MSLVTPFLKNVPERCVWSVRTTLKLPFFSSCAFSAICTGPMKTFGPTFLTFAAGSNECQPCLSDKSTSCFAEHWLIQRQALIVHSNSGKEFGSIWVIKSYTCRIFVAKMLLQLSNPCLPLLCSCKNTRVSCITRAFVLRREFEHRFSSLEHKEKNYRMGVNHYLL